MEDMLRVGVISSTHGVRGEVKVFPTTDDPARFEELETVLLDTGKEKLELEIAGVKFFKNMVILKFKGYDSINDVERYRGKDLWITREQAVPLGEDENFVADLIGLAVVTDGGETLGTMKDVMFTGANDVYHVEFPDGRVELVPAIPQVVVGLDIDAGRMEIRPLEGLFDHDTAL